MRLHLLSFSALGAFALGAFVACGDETIPGNTGGGGASSSTTASSSVASTGSGGATSSSGAGGSVGGSSAPSDLGVEIVGGEVELAWKAPTSPAYPNVRVVRTLNAPPSGPDDPAATTVYSGSASAAVEDLRALTPDVPSAPRTYHYGVYGCTASATCDGGGVTASITPSLTTCLRGGGYTIFWRHASASVCADRLDLGTAATTSVPGWWKSCDASCPAGMTATATARQLNATGEDEATAIGTTMKARGIPVGRVLASEFCRCMKTAELMSFGPAIEPSPDITYYVYDEANRCAKSMDLLAEAPAAGGNTALVSHAGFTCPTLDALAWGEAAIYKPDGAGGTSLVARVLWDQWATLP